MEICFRSAYWQRQCGLWVTVWSHVQAEIGTKSFHLGDEAIWWNKDLRVSYFCHLGAQKALHPEVTHQDPHSAALCDSTRVCRTKTSLQNRRQGTQCSADNQHQQWATSEVKKKKKKSDCIDTACTLPPAVPQFTETAPFTQSVQTLLLYELQDLRLNSLPQFTAAQTQHEATSTQAYKFEQIFSVYYLMN